MRRDILDGGAPSGTRVRLDRLALTVAALVVPSMWVAYFGGKSGFVFDDFRNFRDVQLDGLSLHYLLRPVGDFYFSPGHRLGNWVIQTFFPMSFTMAQLFTVVTFAASLVALYMILIELWRPGPGALVLTALYGLSTIQIEVSHWWTSALQVYPATLCSFLCMLCYLRFQRTGQRALLGWSVGALMIGLLFHSKVAYVPFYLVLFRVFLLQADVPVRTAISMAAREWRTWLAYLIPVVVFMAVFLADFSGGEASLRLLAEYLATLWVRVFVPGLFGASISQGPLSGWGLAGVVLAQMAFFGLAAWALVRVPGAWRAVVVFGAVFLLNSVAIGLTRIAPAFDSTPERVAYSLRYNVEATYMFVMVVAFVLGRRPSRVPAALGAPWKVASVVGIAGYIALAFVGARSLSGPRWIGRRAASWVSNVERGLDEVGYSRDSAAVVDGVVPEYVMFSVLAPANTISEVLPVIDDHVTFDADRRRLLRIGQEGRVERIVFQREAGGDVRDLLASASLSASIPTASPTAKGLCVRTGEAPALVAFTPAAPLEAGDLYVSVRYSSASRRSVALGVVPPGARDAERYAVMMLKDNGEQTNVFPLQRRPLASLFMGVTPHSDICLQRLEIGRVSPAP